MKLLTKAPLFFLTFLILHLVNVPAVFSEETAVPLINEVMSSNSITIQDEDGDYPDWIELYNPGDYSIDLTGYGLSDRPDNPFKWAFESGTIEPAEFLLIFASGKDLRGSPFHWETVITEGDEWRYFVGTSEPPADWNSVTFDDSGWEYGPSGFGYQDDDDATIIPKTISVYIRKTFSVDEVSNIPQCLLQIDYDDAFVAYINGIEIARANIGEAGTPPSYDENAIDELEAQMYSGENPDVFEIENIQSFLQAGDNVLAIQAHNRDAVTFFSDMSVIPFLTFGMEIPPENPRGVPDNLMFSISATLHTNFKINADGETPVLVDKTGTVCDSVFTGEIAADISYGRKPDGGPEWMYFKNSTPGKKNAYQVFQENTDSVTVSLPCGFYDAGISLELSVDSETSEIHYTLDGSEPVWTSPLYSTPLSIDSTTVVRARTFKTGFLPGKITTQTYFIDDSTNMPVVSVSSDPANFFDWLSGIYVMGPDAEPDVPY